MRERNEPLRPVSIGLLAGAALGVAVATARGRGREIDDRLFKLVNAGLRHPALDRVFRGITELGSLYASAAAAAGLALRGHRRAAREALGAAGAAWLAGQALKKAYRRARPYDAGGSRLLIGKPQGTSWPSSHPMVLLAFLTVAGRELCIPRRGRRALAALAGLVAGSRVYLGVHYPADVAGGLVLGRAVADGWSRARGRAGTAREPRD